MLKVHSPQITPVGSHLSIQQLCRKSPHLKPLCMGVTNIYSPQMLSHGVKTKAWPRPGISSSGTVQLALRHYKNLNCVEKSARPARHSFSSSRHSVILQRILPQCFGLRNGCCTSPPCRLQLHDRVRARRRRGGRSSGFYGRHLNVNIHTNIINVKK